ncbi:MAG: right-handed parallel beta-helix repeat-containing protein [Kiritimatiellae bacterium]|nr:right-handed parallel beta-helix repeat-containing protein [Kiritimatiellia bacterium]
MLVDDNSRKFAYGFAFVFAAFAAANAFAAGTLPSGYTEIEYIQGNGNGRIVTDYTPQPNTDKIEAVVEWPTGTFNANQAVWCSRGNGTQVDSWTLFYINDNKKFRYDYMPTGHPVSLVPTDFTVSTATKYTITAEDNTVTYSANGSVLQTQSTPAYSYTAGSVLALFTSHNSGINANVGNYGKHKLYSFKVWRSGELIHYFVPCKDANDVVTMVDICDTPATLTKSGNFTAGQEGHYYDDSAFGSLTILPIPTQLCLAGAEPEPGFTVSNTVTGAFWVFAEGAVAPEGCPFEASYSFDNGVGTVTATGKVGSEYEGESVKRSYNLTQELLVNGGFESGNWAPGWTASGNYAKIDTSASAYGPNQNTTFISGSYCAILQKRNVATQVFTNDSPYGVEVSWKCKQRGGYSGVPYEVTIDGNRIFYEDFPTSTSEVHYRTVEDVLLPPGEHTLKFETFATADRTLFLDDVSLEIVSKRYVAALPIPDQFYGAVGDCRPEFVVSNVVNAQTWTLGGDIVSEDFDVAYSNNVGPGVATVTVTGKGDLSDNVFTTTFKIYGRVKSITSTGAQYIDTGIVPGPTTAVEMHFCATNNAANTSFFGAGIYNQGNSYCLFQNGMYYFIGKNGTSLRYLYEAGVDTVISINTNAAYNCYLNVGGNIATSTISLAYSGSNNLHIFASNNGGNKSKLTLYSFKIWQDGELVRDFVPVRGNAVGLWDFVTSTFFGNAGTGAFIAGPDETDIAVAKIPNQFYTGDALAPDVVVSNLAGTALLAKGVDYTVAYEDNAAVGTGKAIVTGLGAYRSVVTNEFAIYSAPTPAMPATAYVQHGLMNHWDAIDNVGTGTFDPAATTWKDLKGNLDFTLTDRADWGGGFLDMHGFAGAAGGKTGKYLTMEIKYRSTNSRLGMPFFSGYGWNRVAWYRYASQLWFHHRTAETRNTLTGMATPDATDREIAVIYGAGDAPRWFYEGGVPRTSGISNQMFNTGELDWVTSFTRASIGGASETQYNYDGRLYSIRLYDCPLSEKEIAYNAAVDKVRYEGVAPAEAFNSSDMRWNETSGKVEVLINLALVNGIGRLSINGGGASAWVSHGDEVKIEYKPVGDEKALEWFGLPGGAPRSADLFTVTFTAEAPVAAALQMLKKVDATRVLNADPGVEESSGAPVCWNRTSGSAWIGGHGSSSDERGFYYLYPYQGNIFFQEGLALPAGTYTLTFDHAAETDGLAYYWRLYDATNGIHSICNVTNDLYAYGTSWHTVQADFTIAEGGIYKLQTGMASGGGNCLIRFDNISITSDTDLHIEVEKCYPYLGEAQVRPPVVVRDDDGNILTEGVDYELLYGANNSVGTNLDGAVSLRHGNGYVAAKGLGTHYGVAGANFRIGKPIYVKPDGLPTNGGTSWADAVDFATALTNAVAPHINHEIWIAGSNVLTSAVASQLFYGNKIFRGGFKGTESTIEEREPGAYSVIDGDGQFSAIAFRASCNAFFERLHFRGSPARAVSKTSSGGDVFIDDCVFEDNGNAVYVQGVDRSPYDQGSVFVKNSVFRNNSSTDAADGSAALYSYQTRRVSVENSLFASNTLATSSKVKTSAIFAQSSAIELKGCDFVGNIGSGSTYGTVRASGINALNTIENCLFRGNQMDGANGAAVSIEHSTLEGRTEIANCTFTANANATDNGCTGVKGVKGQFVVRNSIFVGNGVDFVDSANSAFDIDYTLLADNTGATCSFVNGASELGASMVYGDPLFAATDDCHLLSEAGYFDSEGSLHYAAAGVRSPAIDAGDPASDYSRESAPNGGCVNLGRYGNTAEASRTPSASPAVDAPTIAWNDPDGYTMPTVSFTMGGSGSYTAHGVVYVSTDGGATWEDVSGIIGGLVTGQTKTLKVPVYYTPGGTIQVKVAIAGAGQESESAVASSTVSGTLPPWYGKKGPANVVHVRPGAVGRNDGTSWTDAFASWPDALAASSSLKNEIWVAGTNIVTETIPTKAFTFPAVIRGGFTGVECALSERPEGLRSVIDGQNNFDTFKFSNTESVTVDSIEFLRGEYRGLKKTTSTGDVMLTNCVFYGCTIGKGNWDGNGNSNVSYQYGGGGAGLYGSGSAKATVVDCRFEGNIINSAGGNGGFGGGLYVGSFGGGADIYRCSFVTNYMQRNFDSSRASMAALHVYNTRATVDGCSFYGHYAEGIADVHGSCSGSVFRRCSFVGNYGGGSGVLSVKLNNTTDKALIENCTFAYNVSHGLNCVKGATAVTNCIFYGNLVKTNATAAADLRVAADATATVDYCLFAAPEEDGSTICVSEATAGTLEIGQHCIYGNPFFVTPTNTVMEQVKSPDGATMPRALPSNWSWSWSKPVPTFEQAMGYDVHLCGGRGYVDEKTGQLVADYSRLAQSLAIDAGDPASDYRGEPLIRGVGYHGRRVNLGAYGNTPWATMSTIPGFYIRLR